MSGIRTTPLSQSFVDASDLGATIAEMTLVLALRCHEGVVLASDSQRTQGTFRQETQKLFTTTSGIAWGAAGNLAVQQELTAAFEESAVAPHPTRSDGRLAILDAVDTAVGRVTAQIQDAPPSAGSLRGIFAWHSLAEAKTYVLRVGENGQAEFASSYTSIGSPFQLALFAFSRSEHLGYATLPLEAAKMVAFDIADDVIRASAREVSHPVQMAYVTHERAALVDPLEVRGIEETVAAFREHQRNFLAREEADVEAGRDTGIRP
jgi:proteasome beta subunit